MTSDTTTEVLGEVSTSRVRVVAETLRTRFVSRGGADLTFEGDAPYLWGAASELGIPLEITTNALLAELRRAALQGHAYQYVPHPSHTPSPTPPAEIERRRRVRASEARARKRIARRLEEMSAAAKVGERQPLLPPELHPGAWVTVDMAGLIELGPQLRFDAACKNLVLPAGADIETASARWSAIVESSAPLRAYDPGLEP